MKTAIRSKSMVGVVFLGLLVMACATGYNKPANDYYEEGLLFSLSMSGRNSYTTTGPGPAWAKKIMTPPSPITIWRFRWTLILISLISAVRPFGR